MLHMLIATLQTTLPELDLDCGTLVCASSPCLRAEIQAWVAGCTAIVTDDNVVSILAADPINLTHMIIVHVIYVALFAMAAIVVWQVVVFIYRKNKLLAMQYED